MKDIYHFGAGKADGSAQDKALLGGKGANLAEMNHIGLPIPPGFTLTTETCMEFVKHGELPESIVQQLPDAIAQLEACFADAHGSQEKAPRFGNPKNPLLVSVRSGGRASMPGMMDTVLNLGLNDETVEGLIAQSGDARFAYDAYRRFINMYGDVVMGVEHEHFEHALEQAKEKAGVEYDTELSADNWKEVVGRYKAIVADHANAPLPQDPMEQLLGSIKAVFASWDNPRAITYRKANDIPDDWGTAVNVQAMVFGNMGNTSATGVAFTRDPATGENRFYGEYLVNAQGEDVVAGIRTPQPISGADESGSLESVMPDLYRKLVEFAEKLEQHYTEMQDLEFTIQKGTLWMLQTRTGKRTADAAVRIAVEMADSGLIDRDTALCRVDPDQLDQLLHPRLDPSAEKNVLATGLPASPGAVSGKVVFHPEEAEAAAEQGIKTILVRVETSPEDIQGMISAEGILTARGGMTSHAAVVSRGMGKPCVAGCRALEVDYASASFRIGDLTVNKGEVITIDGAAGEVILGDVPRLPPKPGKHFKQLMAWADERRRLGVRTNADTPHDSATAREFGCEGIGLCRTEHMFFDAERIDLVRAVILSDNEEKRQPILDKLRAFQQADFEGIFEAMDGLPVTIRLLDPPLHEFLPSAPTEIAALSERIGLPEKVVQTQIEKLHESNPMLGHRGCRLGVTAPEIYRMQVQAIFLAALAATKRGVVVLPEIMVPLISTASELALIAEMTHAEAKTTFEAEGETIKYLVGTMIELPRACLVADEVAKYAEFFSFGTNDLTQTTFGLSRDDAGNFLPVYVSRGLLEQDPFVSVDVDGVGQLMEIGVTKGRSVRPDLKVGICGEHGGEPKSVTFCHNLGLDYVSCSPYRVPIARLAAAQAAVKE